MQNPFKATGKTLTLNTHSAIFSKWPVTQLMDGPLTLFSKAPSSFYSVPSFSLPGNSTQFSLVQPLSALKYLNFQYHIFCLLSPLVSFNSTAVYVLLLYNSTLQKKFITLTSPFFLSSNKGTTIPTLAVVVKQVFQKTKLKMISCEELLLCYCSRIVEG